MGGLSIPYATTPMNSKAGMTIGGTMYFMRFSRLKENAIGCTSWARPARVDARSQHAGKDCGTEGEAGEQYHRLPIFLLPRTDPLSTL